MNHRPADEAELASRAQSTDEDTVDARTLLAAVDEAAGRPVNLEGLDEQELEKARAIVKEAGNLPHPHESST